MCVTLTNGDSSEPSGTSDEYPSGHVDGLGSGVSPDPFILKTVSLTKSNVTRCLISSLLASELPVTFLSLTFSPNFRHQICALHSVPLSSFPPLPISNPFKTKPSSHYFPISSSSSPLSALSNSPSSSPLLFYLHLVSSAHFSSPFFIYHLIRWDRFYFPKNIGLAK